MVICEKFKKLKITWVQSFCIKICIKKLLVKIYGNFEFGILFGIKDRKCHHCDNWT